MRRVLAWSKRLSVLTLCVAFVAAFVLPCLCAAVQPASHASHCGDAKNGLKAAMGRCCCSDLPAAAETAANLAPAAPGAPLVLDALAVPFLVVRAHAAVTPFRLLHGPPVSRVLRI
jgi:hypothetical protein